MKIVIQCAGSKQSTAASLADASGASVRFCADPAHADSLAPHAQPDDRANGSGQTWRDKLAAYNQEFARTGENPTNLLSAGSLYTPPAYAKLRAATAGFFVLSAGWGLVRSSYLLPDYDVTFSKNKNVPLKSRRSMRQGGWKDFNHLTSDTPPDEEIHFFGSKEYLALFCVLAEPERREGWVVIHHKGPVVQNPRCRYEHYTGTTRTNWHYVALSEFLAYQSGRTR